MQTTAHHPLNPRVIGQTESALGALLGPVLADTGTSFEQWVVLAVAWTCTGGFAPASSRSRAACSTSPPRTWPLPAAFLPPSPPAPTPSWPPTPCGDQRRQGGRGQAARHIHEGESCPNTGEKGGVTR